MLYSFSSATTFSYENVRKDTLIIFMCIYVSIHVHRSIVLLKSMRQYRVGTNETWVWPEAK